MEYSEDEEGEEEIDNAEKQALEAEEMTPERLAYIQGIRDSVSLLFIRESIVREPPPRKNQQFLYSKIEYKAPHTPHLRKQVFDVS